MFCSPFFLLALDRKAEENAGDVLFGTIGWTGNYRFTFEVDNENGVITNNMDLNLYPYFNFEFFKLVCGDNLLEVVGNCMLEIQCEFPVNVGG